MNKLNRCLSGDVDSIEMYILPEELDPGEGREFRNLEKSYQSTSDITHRSNYNAGEISSGERYSGNGEDIERYTKLPGCTKDGPDMKEEAAIDRRGGPCPSRVGQCQDKAGPQGEEEPAYCSFRFLVLLSLSASAFVQVQQFFMQVTSGVNTHLLCVINKSCAEHFHQISSARYLKFSILALNYCVFLEN